MAAPAPAAPVPEPAPAEPATPDPVPARMVEVEEAAPPQVKRGGWWQRAKASFGGN